MAEYIKREDVIEKLTGLFQLQAETAKAIVESIPTADVVEWPTGGPDFECHHCWYDEDTGLVHRECEG